MFQLPEQDRRSLLRIARDAVKGYLSADDLELPQIDEGFLAQPYGVFVSIHRGQTLRGCIGNVSPKEPLHRTTARCAISAATADPRFPAVTPEELPLLQFELSVLSAPELVSNPEKIEIGKHGLIVTRGAARGLLLPQVATQYGWDRYQFLAETCIKAGVSRDAWRQGSDIYCFTAEVFAENHIHQPARS